MRAILLLTLTGCATAPAPKAEVVRYFRVTPQKTGLECSFSVIRGDGWTITSVTGSLSVDARYDGDDRLLDAQASLRGGATVRVEAADEKAKVHAPGRELQEFSAPPGLIVTSAPDWTDAFLICRRWKRDGPAKQIFQGLWIHPVQLSQRLVFSAERVRRDKLATLELDVLTIRLRGGSAYRAWADPAGRLIKLASFPPAEDAVLLVREGFDAAATLLADE